LNTFSLYNSKYDYENIQLILTIQSHFSNYHVGSIILQGNNQLIRDDIQ